MSQKIRIKLKSYDHNLVEGYRSSGKWSDSTSYSQGNFYCKSLYVREQKEPRAILGMHVQKINRHLQFNCRYD